MEALFFLGVDVIKETLMLLCETEIILLLVDVASHCEGGLRKMLEIRFAERPSHDVKWPLLMAEMKVDLTGLKAAA